jgi:hypothetical protein
LLSPDLHADANLSHILVSAAVAFRPRVVLACKLEERIDAPRVIDRRTRKKDRVDLLVLGIPRAVDARATLRGEVPRPVA